jgi:hypothetical protein
MKGELFVGASPLCLACGEEIGGAVVYLTLFYLGRMIAPDFWLFRK